MRTLKINLLYACTARCAHCRFHCTTERSGTPDFDTPYAVAAQLHAHFGLDMAVLLGGEPSLFSGETQALLARLHGLGISTRLETNANWATSGAAAADFLVPLKASGTAVMLSLDAFHEPYIPYGNVVNALRACSALDIPVNLEVPYLDIGRKTHPLDVRTRELEERVLAEMSPGISVFRGNVVFTGRAAETFGEAFAVGKGVPDMPCTEVPWWIDSGIESTDLLVLEPGGWLTKGCGVAIGNVHARDVVRMVRDYKPRDNPVLSVLLTEGPLGLAREAEKHGYRLRAEYADRCHLCHEARRALRKVYPDVLQPDAHYN